MHGEIPGLRSLMLFAVGLAQDLHKAAMASVFAFLAGGIILNVLKGEFSEGRKSSLGAFLRGAAGYSVVLLAR